MREVSMTPNIYKFRICQHFVGNREEKNKYLRLKGILYVTQSRWIHDITYYRIRDLCNSHSMGKV